MSGKSRLIARRETRDSLTCAIYLRCGGEIARIRAVPHFSPLYFFDRGRGIEG